MEGQDLPPEKDLRVRTKSFALAVVRLYTALPNSAVAQVLGRQMLRSGTSVGARQARRLMGPSRP
jgi:four helix bundle protein